MKINYHVPDTLKRKTKSRSWEYHSLLDRQTYCLGSRTNLYTFHFEESFSVLKEYFVIEILNI